MLQVRSIPKRCLSQQRRAAHRQASLGQDRQGSEAVETVGPAADDDVVLEAAARHGSLQQAGAELGVTHGAVSRQIGLLEDWLGPPGLFRQAGRRAVLTADGEALLGAVRPALEQIAAAARAHRDRRGIPVGRPLRVNALATFSLRWLLPRLTLFRAAHPEIAVRLTTSNDPLEALSDAQISQSSHQSSKRMAVSTSSPCKLNTRGNRSRMGRPTSPCSRMLVDVAAAVMANSTAARCRMRRGRGHSARQDVAPVATIAIVASRISASGPKPGGSGNRTKNGNTAAPSKAATDAVTALRPVLMDPVRRAGTRPPRAPRSHRGSGRGCRHDRPGSRAPP